MTLIRHLHIVSSELLSGALGLFPVGAETQSYGLSGPLCHRGSWALASGVVSQISWRKKRKKPEPPSPYRAGLSQAAKARPPLIGGLVGGGGADLATHGKGLRRLFWVTWGPELCLPEANVWLLRAVDTLQWETSSTCVTPGCRVLP